MNMQRAEALAAAVAAERARLEAHGVYAALRDLADLRVFMAHHVYSVWDFMSLIKYLQNELAPAGWPWKPVGDAIVRRFINDLVIEEESDAAPDEDGAPAYASHFELYCRAMREIGGDPSPAVRFAETAADEGFPAALEKVPAPPPAAAFMAVTFGLIGQAKPHVAAAAFALGREHMIPGLFRALLRDTRVGQAEAPVFHYYLNRHIHLDEDFHGPMSLRMLAVLCGDDDAKWAEAEDAAKRAVAARLAFWDGVLDALRRADRMAV